MNGALLLAGLPVCVAAGGLSILMLMAGWTGAGLVVLALALLAAMFVAGQALPRPVVVPRPGEEEQYTA